MSESILDAALSFAERGWRVVPVDPIKKAPLCGRDWQKAATVDPTKIESWWEKWPAAGVGVVMGRDSGIIDVECDSPEAEQLLQELFQGELPACPTFQSTRGKHRLFKWHHDLPEPDKAVFKIGPNKALEFRTGCGGGCQTVFPPTPTSDGKPRHWLHGLDLDDVDPPSIPPEVMARVQAYALEGAADSSRSRKGRDWKSISSGETPIPEGQRNDTATAFVGKLLASLKDPWNAEDVENLRRLMRSWNETACKPPMADVELKRTFDSILQRHRNSSGATPGEAGTSPPLNVVRQFLRVPVAKVLRRGRPEAGATYSLVLDDGRSISLGHAPQRMGIVRDAVFQATGLLFPADKRTWPECAQALWTVAEDIPVEDFSDTIMDLLRGRVEKTAKRLDTEAPEGSADWWRYLHDQAGRHSRGRANDGRVWGRISRLWDEVVMQFRPEGLKLKNFNEILSANNWCFQDRSIRTEGQSRRVRLWESPAGFVDAD